MLAILERDPDLYLDEIQDELYFQHGIEASLSTIWRTLRRLGLSMKKLSRAAAERSEHQRRLFTLAIGGEPLERIVTADESAVNVLTTFRENGWAYRGKRAQKATNFVRGQRYSLLPAITANGLLYCDIKKGGYSGDDFLHWLDKLLEYMNPYPAPQSILVLDNCRIHHVPGVEEKCAKKGIRLVYLPPYSPDLNPIEECFSFVKSFIRRHGLRFRLAVQTGDKSGPFLFLYEALNAVTASQCRGWFHHSGYI
jgi:transposase